MATDDETMKALQAALDGRLGMMTSVVNEATRSAALAAGAAMEVRGQLQGLREGLARVEAAQLSQGERLARHGETLESLKGTCAQRGAWCDRRFQDASEDIKSAWGAADRAWRDSLKPVHARITKHSAETERLRTEMGQSVVELRDKLGQVRESTDVRHIRSIQHQAEERGKERALALARARREKQVAKATAIAKIVGKVLLAITGVGAGGAGLLALLRALMG
jgi:hypothetical protein